MAQQSFLQWCCSWAGHTSVLLCGWGRNGPAVVAADEEHRRRQSGSKIQGRMEISLAGSAFTEVDSHNHSLALHLQMQQLALA